MIIRSVLTGRERTVAVIANGIAVYSMLRERGELPEGTTVYGFVLEVTPSEIKESLDPELIDDVFESVSAAHGS